MINKIVLSTLIYILLLPVTGMSQDLSWDEKKKESIKELCDKYLTKNLIVWQQFDDQDGKVVFECGDSDTLYNIFSVRKSLTNLLIGIYYDRGLIDINSTLEDLKIDDIESLSSEEKQASVLQLLKSSSGIYHPAAFETPGMKNRRPGRGSHKPGEKWFYNNWNFNALTTILEEVASESIFETFKREISKPLSLEDFKIEDQQYIREKEVSEHPATLWKFTGRDLLKIGQLMLNGGVYNGEEIISEDWIELSTEPYSDLGILGGYGLCWWVALHGQHYPFIELPNGTFSARGTGEQNLMVIPEYRLVIVHLTEVNSPNDPMMKVTEFGRLLSAILK